MAAQERCTWSLLKIFFGTPRADQLVSQARVDGKCACALQLCVCELWCTREVGLQWFTPRVLVRGAGAGELGGAEWDGAACRGGWVGPVACGAERARKSRAARGLEGLLGHAAGGLPGLVNWWGVLDVWQKFCTSCVLYRHPLAPWPSHQPSNIHNHQQRLVSLGWVSEALYVLGMHSHWAAWSSALGSQLGLESSLRRLDAVASLLRCFPRLAPQGLPADVPGQALQGADEFLEYRARWQAQCAALLRDEALWAGGGNDAASCREVVRCMAGEQPDADAAARTWLELLVSRLLSEHAVIGRQADLLQLLRTCVAARPRAGPTTRSSATSPSSSPGAGSTPRRPSSSAPTAPPGSPRTPPTPLRPTQQARAWVGNGVRINTVTCAGF